MCDCEGREGETEDGKEELSEGGGELANVCEVLGGVIYEEEWVSGNGERRGGGGVHQTEKSLYKCIS